MHSHVGTTAEIMPGGHVAQDGRGIMVRSACYIGYGAKRCTDTVSNRISDLGDAVTES